MGDGKKLKEYLDEKGTNVRRIAKETGISATTLYTIIQKDSNIRFDFALRLANALDIDVNEICSASPFSGAITEEEIYPTLPDGLNGALDASRVKTYLKNSLYPLMYLFGKNSMPDVDNLLTSFYQLDDEARKEVVETIQFKLQYHRDPERAEQVKQIKGWWTYCWIRTCCYYHRVIKYYSVNSRVSEISPEPFLHAIIMKMGVSGAKTVPKRKTPLNFAIQQSFFLTIP